MVASKIKAVEGLWLLIYLWVCLEIMFGSLSLLDVPLLNALLRFLIATGFATLLTAFIWWAIGIKEKQRQGEASK